MFAYDPRFPATYGHFGQFGGYPTAPVSNGAWGNNNPVYGQMPMNPNWTSQVGYAPVSSYAAANGGYLTTAEGQYLMSRIEEMRVQLIANNDLLRSDLARRNWIENSGSAHTTNQNAAVGYPYGVIPFQRPQAAGFMTSDVTPVRLRESDSQIYCDIYLPQLNIGDVEVETSGNRIVCRTRVPVAPISRWLPTMTQLPRGFECFELPDGRIEFSWLCHVPFQAKDVEATFRDGFLCICVTKVETTTNRHPIKVAKETSVRRAANETHS